MDLEALKNKEFTDADLERIKNTRDVKFTPSKDRMTVNIGIVYEQRGESPFVADVRKCRPIQHSENAVKRRYDIPANQSKTIDYQWLEGKAGTILIFNATGMGLAANPTPEQKKIIDASAASVFIKDVELPLMPKEPMLIPVPKEGQVIITAGQHPVSMQVWIMPR